MISIKVCFIMTRKRVFTLRLEEEIFDKIGIFATAEHRSMTNYIEHVLLHHINEVENGEHLIGPNFLEEIR